MTNAQRHLYLRTLRTMTEVLEDLRAEPEHDQAVIDLIESIEADRECVRTGFALGEEPRRPFAWLSRPFPTA